MKLEDILKNQKHPEYEELAERLRFMRRAINRELRGRPGKIRDLSSAKAIAYKDADPIEGRHADTYLVRLPIEEERRFNNRIQMAFDGGESVKVLREYIGHIMRGGYTLTTNWPEQVQEQLFTNIDGNGSTFEVFMAETIFELMGMGKAWILTRTNSKGQVMSEIIKREDVLDWQYEDGELLFFKYKRQFSYLDGVQRITGKQVILITPDEWIISQKKNDKLEIVSREPNPLGYVPARDAWMGAYAQSVVDSIADLQFLIMNMDSIWKQKIILQALNLLTVPNQADMADQMASLSTSSFLMIDSGVYQPSWLAYPAQSLDADASYIQYMIERERSISTLRGETTEQSGYAKSWDFLATQTILSTAATAIDGLFTQVLEDWRAYYNFNSPAEFALKRNYDPRNLAETLDLILKTLSIGVGQVAENKLRKLARDSMDEIGLAFSEKEKAESDREIDSQSELGEELKRMLLTGDANNGSTDNDTTGN